MSRLRAFLDQILCKDAKSPGSAKSALMQTQLAFCSLSQVPKKNVSLVKLYLLKLHHIIALCSGVALNCLSDGNYFARINKKEQVHSAGFLCETKNANFISVFLCARELLQSVSPRSHYPLCKNWAWPQHGFLISFRAKTRLILLVMSSPSRSAVAERAACGRE